MCHVLIIEDEILVAIDLEALLAGLGATSFSFAETEADAIEQARRRRPDLITSDVHLRSGFGPTAVATIQKEAGPVPVIFVTAHPEACKPCGPPTRILDKPIHEARLSEAFLQMAPL